MNTKMLLVAAASFMLVSQASIARDTRHHFPIAEALTTSAAQEKVDPSIKLYWGDQAHAKPERSFGTFKTNKKTNFFNKSDKEGCEWAFLSAVITLQERAKAEGGNAVINIRSIYRNGDFSSQTEYECGAGNVVGGVALEGEVVKL